MQAPLKRTKIPHCALLAVLKITQSYRVTIEILDTSNTYSYIFKDTSQFHTATLKLSFSMCHHSFRYPVHMVSIFQDTSNCPYAILKYPRNPINIHHPQLNSGIQLIQGYIKFMFQVTRVTG